MVKIRHVQGQDNNRMKISRGAKAGGQPGFVFLDTGRMKACIR